MWSAMQQLDGVCLDRETRQLRWGRRAVEVRPQPFRILETLITAQDGRVTRQQLEMALYHGRRVPPNAIATGVSLARSALRAVGSPVTVGTLDAAAYRLVTS